MVDSKEIEELRALAFASIPAVARKGQRSIGNTTSGEKRKRTSIDTAEDGEILSDEDAVAAAAAAMAMATSMGFSASKSVVDCSSSGSFREAVLGASTDQRGIVRVSSEVTASLSTESPSLVAVVPSHTQMLGSEGNQGSDSNRPLTIAVAKYESATFKLESIAKNEETKSSQRNEKMMHPLRSLKSSLGSLPSRIPSAPLPSGGLRKEADAFLASLNIPASASPSHLSGFTGDRNDSLVIKFSDDDSDSDGGQDGQVAVDKSSNKTWITNEPLVSSSLGARMGLSSQSTSGLKSEIDRVKKQIAAIERAKGMVGVPPVSKLSKTTTVEVSRPSNLKASGTTRSAPVDLESLRQQIAAKESELKLRKQKGLKEPQNNGNVPASSSWLIDAIDLTQAPDAGFSLLEKSENETGGAEVPTEDGTSMSGLQLNETPNNMSCSSFKEEEAVSFGPDRETVSILDQQVLDVATTTGLLSMAQAVQTSTVSSDTQLLNNLKDQRDNLKSALESCEPTTFGEVNDVSRNKANSTAKCESCEPTLMVGKINDVSRNKANKTPKRKRHESDQASKFFLPPLRRESAKKQKRKGCSDFAESLMYNRVQEAGSNLARLSDFSLDGGLVSIFKVSDVEKHANKISDVKENAVYVQGMPTALSTATEPEQDIRFGQGIACPMPNATNGTDATAPTCVEKANLQSTHTDNLISENAVLETAVLLQPNTSEGQHSVKEGSAKIIEVISVQDNIGQADDTRKYASASIDAAFSPLSSPSRAIAERQGDSMVFPGNQRMLEGILVGAGSTCPSVPAWNHLHNSKRALVHAVDDQRLEFGDDALWKLQEEEDAIDKELEEAQQNRRRCEVREHFARRQHRDAQEALRSANLHCEMLFQKREMLSASFKAAQLHLYASKSSLVSQHGEGALVPLRSPMDPFRFKTPFWGREKGETGKSSRNHVSDQDHDGFDPDFTLVSKQSKALPRFQLDGHFVSEKTQSGATLSGLDEPVVFDTLASKLMVGQPDNRDMLVHGRSQVVEKVIECTNTEFFSTSLKGANTVSNLSKEPSSQCLQDPSIGPVVRGTIPDSGSLAINSVSQMCNDEGKPLMGEEISPLIINFKEAVCGKSSEKESHHGFSSASFATDLETDANQNNIVVEKSKTLREGQKTTAEQCSFSFQPLSLHTAQASLTEEQASNKSTNKSQSGRLKISPTVGNDNSMCARKDLANLSFCQQVTEFDKTQHEPCAAESRLGEKASPTSQKQDQLRDGKTMNSTLKETFTNPSSADTCLDRQPYPRCRDDMANKLWSVEGSTVHLDEVREGSKRTYLDKENPSVGIGQRFVMQELQKSEVPIVDLCRKVEDSKQLVRTSEAELEIGSVVYKLPVTLDRHFKVEENSASLICFVPSASLKLLFSHALHLHMFDACEQQIIKGVSDESVQVVSGSYESPLCTFHSYGRLRQSVDNLHSSVYGQLHAIDPHRVLCMYEHRGKCNNDECIWQHKRDYMVGPTLTRKQLHSNADDSEFPKAPAEKERKGLNSTHSDHTGSERSDGSMAALKTSSKWNVQVTKVPVYRIGSYLRKTHCSESLFSCTLSKGQLGFGQPFAALHRQVPMDMPCLLDSSLKLQTLNDDSAFSRRLRMEDRLWIEDEGQHSGTLGGAESLLEAALELFDFDLKVQKTEVRKSVLYVLSRGLEVNPSAASTWVVYLHLFYRWEKSSCKDDLFVNAVQHNKGSYELWMMFINSRRHLMDRLNAYDSAIVALGGKVQLQGHPLESKSSFLLDLALQKLNFMCTSDLCQEAASWIDNVTAAASEEVEDFGRHEGSSMVLLAFLEPCDLCILWICCAYVMLQNQLPINVIERLGCKQHPSLWNIWVASKHKVSCNSQVMKIMRIGASHGKGCMKLDVNDPADKSFQRAKEVFIANFVQCAAVCESRDCSLTIAKKYFNLFSPSVELTLLRAQLEEHQKGKMASLDIFEEALTRWPLHQSGKMVLWNQYLASAFEAKGSDFVKMLLGRCAQEIHDCDSSSTVSEKLGSSTPTILNSTRPSKCTQQQASECPQSVSMDRIRSAFQLLPSIVKQQLVKDCGCATSQRFSYQDVVFGYVNLAFLEALHKDGSSARNALQSSLNVAADADSMQHCLQEIAVFTCGVFDSPSTSSASVFSPKLLGLFDRCMLEMQLLGAGHSLSRGFCECIKRRKTRQFVSSLLGPPPSDSGFLNSILESIHGPTLLPRETQPWRNRVDFTEKVLEILPSNVRLAASLCRVVQSRVAEQPTEPPATLFWCISLLIDSLCQVTPEAPEPAWVEAGEYVRMLEIDSLLEDFYRRAISVHPFSSSLWHGFLTVSSKTGNLNSALEAAKERGVKLDSQYISSE